MIFDAEDWGGYYGALEILITNLLVFGKFESVQLVRCEPLWILLSRCFGSTDYLAEPASLPPEVSDYLLQLGLYYSVYGAETCCSDDSHACCSSLTGRLLGGDTLSTEEESPCEEVKVGPNPLKISCF